VVAELRGVRIGFSPSLGYVDVDPEIGTAVAAAVEVLAQLGPDPAEHLGLDREEDDVRTVDRLEIAGHGPDAVLALELLAAFEAGMAGRDLVRADELPAQEAGDHRLGHHPGADRGDPAIGQGRHRPSIENRDGCAGPGCSESNGLPVDPTARGMSGVTRGSRPGLEPASTSFEHDGRAAQRSEGEQDPEGLRGDQLLHVEIQPIQVNGCRSPPAAGRPPWMRRSLALRPRLATGLPWTVRSLEDERRL